MTCWHKENELNIPEFLEQKFEIQVILAKKSSIENGML